MSSSSAPITPPSSDAAQMTTAALSSSTTPAMSSAESSAASVFGLSSPLQVDSSLTSSLFSAPSAFSQPWMPPPHTADFSTWTPPIFTWTPTSTVVRSPVIMVSIQFVSLHLHQLPFQLLPFPFGIID
ncbi:unnamed protein product [Cuscuta epithymum]|uniref:Uncharacterized protein n=1 Tax=Cuscuta epithymum TaxID=186058 RepID=A0AAV0C6G4_9ASTE|nr:unnamed protein product [Cuscuta epithymum]